MNKKASPLNSIRAKLLSAVSMLIVAVIMVISSTYAWFTLSTAPEVKGINTAIGANGALEMALQNTDGTVDETPDSNATDEERNNSWGNLVDVSNNAVYGSGSITLLPSQLNLATAGKLSIASFLKTPKYGADGRLETVEANTVTGTFVENSFSKNENYGFRAVGVASGMTDRELAFRNMKAGAGTSMGLAKNTASASLNTNGSALANMVVAHATYGGSPADEKYTYAEVSALMNIVNDLLGTVDSEGNVVNTGALQHIENAYHQYIIAYAAQQKLGDGLAWNALQTAYNEGTTLFEAFPNAGTDAETTLPAEFNALIANLRTTKSNVEAAKTILVNALKDKTSDSTIEWGSFSGAFTELIDPDNMEVNGIKAKDVMSDENQNKLVNSVASSGITVTMKRGGGVYSDVADHCGDFTASIKLNLVYGSMKFENLDARMVTDAGYDSTVTTDTISKSFYLPQIAKFIATQEYVEDAEGSVVKPLTEMYGYIIDLAFRTNAAESNLLLQTAAKDRVYNDNPENNEFTWGGGSTMTFASSSPSFSNDAMKDLMANIKIVFFNTEDGTILGNAVLDTEGAKNTADGFEAAIYLVDATGNMITEQANAKLMALTQNATTKVSALVYLDGDNITNADVAADATTSVTGKLNLQFSSSANLVPMDYADLHVGGAATEGETTAPAEGN